MIQEADQTTSCDINVSINDINVSVVLCGADFVTGHLKCDRCFFSSRPEPKKSDAWSGDQAGADLPQPSEHQWFAAATIWLLSKFSNRIMVVCWLFVISSICIIYIAHVYWPILAIITFTNHHEQIRPTLNPTNHLVLAQDGRRSELHTGPLTAPMKWGWPSSRLGWLAAKMFSDGVVN